MADKMLIDASHEEETRVVVVRGNRIEEFDFESQHKKQLRGNIYLAKVTRVEPSLQAAFVDYGGNRHGFLAFSEIHPDYYQIPVADRQALIEAEARESIDDDDDDIADEEEKPSGRKARASRSRTRSKTSRSRSASSKKKTAENTVSESDSGQADPSADAITETAAQDDGGNATEPVDVANEAAEPADPDATDSGEATDTKNGPDTIAASVDTETISEAVDKNESPDGDGDDDDRPDNDDDSDDEANGKVESVGAEDALEEVPDRARRTRKQYRIQEVIKRRQILLVQVVKEERGNKGAALTTYLSLAGRYSVLMPNTARGGGISRKITNVQDRKRLKEVARGLEVPQGMGVILRTAGANRTKAEVKRDFEYLMRLWENVRNLTLTSTAPSLVYEEGSLIKRSIRDLYNKDISEIVVSGEEGYREAKDFMKMLMPSHAKAVQPYRDVQPIYARSGIEAQLDKMLQPQVTLKSGGYVIINQTEALVAIDVNSGRATKEHSIEDTALKTNLEAAEEAARQLRLRDLAGLIVIDFIDMEEKRNNRAVEKRLKDCLKHDRARIQVGRISHFGLLEMSRQRIRASVLESTMQVCEHCGGTGHVRSPSSVALHVLRTAEEYLLRNTKYSVTLRTSPETALYVLNHKRETIRDLEARFGLTITVDADSSVGQQMVSIDQGEPVENPVVVNDIVLPPMEIEPDVDIVDTPGQEDDTQDAESDGRRRKRRRRKRGGRGEDSADREAESPQQSSSEDVVQEETASSEDGEGKRKRRRRGKRGGRRSRDAEDGMQQADADEAASQTQEDDTASTAPNTDTPNTVAEDAVEPVSTEPLASEEAVGTADVGGNGEEQTSSAIADTTETESSGEAVADEPAGEKPAPSRRRRRTSKEAVASEPVLTSTEVSTEEQPEAKPKKGGWWQRRGFL